MNRIARRLLTLARLPRAARGAAMALVLALVVAAPVAAAAPTRTVYDLEPFLIHAGRACAFDVEGQPSWGFQAETDFSDGSVLYSVQAHGAYVNVDTGASFWVEDTYRQLIRVDAQTGNLLVVESGSISQNFHPGDVGPYGVAGSNGEFYDFRGTIRFTYDTVLNRITEFASTGTVTDICAALS